MVLENQVDNCEGCSFCEPIKKILIIKYGAAGDILRTTPILSAIKKKFGENTQIYWITNERDIMLIKDNPEIDYKLVFNHQNIRRLNLINFHALFSLEADKEILAVANSINAEKKYGFFLDEGDNPACFNKGAEGYLEKIWSNRLNKGNRRTYQEFLFEICELEYHKEDYSFYLDNYEKKLSEQLKKENSPIIGVSIAVGSKWPSKHISNEKKIELIEKLHKLNLGKIMIISGIQEKELKENILNKLKEKGINDIISWEGNTTADHIAEVESCDTVICGDSLSMHIALALKKKVIGLFLCTPPWEIEDYGRMTKITSPLLDKYFFTDQYEEELVNSISVEEIINELELKKIFRNINEIKDLITNLEKKGKKVMITNGCFDLLHAGHITFLEYAKKQCDVLIVAINSDKSVRAYKGQNRPINNEDFRAYLLSKIKDVDYVYIFDETKFEGTLRELKPKLYAKGRDYTLETIEQTEREIIESYGGKIIIVKHPIEITTSEIIKKMNEPEVRVVNAIIKNPLNETVLVIKRKNESIHEGKWAFPGGIVKEGESNEIALKREIQEEVGLKINKIIKKISEYTYTRPDGKFTLGISYLVEAEGYVIIDKNEVSDSKWVTVEEFENLDHIEGLEKEIFDAFYL